MPKEVKKPKGDRPKKPWEQGTVFASSSGLDMTQMSAIERLHAEKDALGRSVNAVKAAERTNALKKEVKRQEAARAKVSEANKQGSLIGMDVQSVASAPDPRKSRRGGESSSQAG